MSSEFATWLYMYLTLPPPNLSSGLDKDLDQWVFHPLLFNLMSILLHIKYQIAENAKPCKRPNICLTYFKEKLLVSNTCCIFRKTSKSYTIGVY